MVVAPWLAGGLVRSVASHEQMSCLFPVPERQSGFTSYTLSQSCPETKQPRRRTVHSPLSPTQGVDARHTANHQWCRIVTKIACSSCQHIKRSPEHDVRPCLQPEVKVRGKRRGRNTHDETSPFSAVTF